MPRKLGGIAILFHAFAHAGFGVWAGSVGPIWIVTPLWTAAIVGNLVAGLGLLGVRPFARWWPNVLSTATAASVILLILFSHPVFVAGLVADIAILSVLIHRVRRGDSVPALSPARHPAVARTVTALSLILLTYVAAAIVMRPVFVQWGTTDADRAIALPGDLPGDAGYRLDHAITIKAPADSVWRWLVQIGQDRGGFYSYSWLERLFGADIQNAERLRSEWQSMEAGDFVRAVQPGYLGGLFGAAGDSLGWRVTKVNWGRSFILENWGTFALVPIDSFTTRFIIRTRGEGAPGAPMMIFGPIEVFAFEPAHFIMQRGMMMGIRDRAERRGA
jgi:hypothetical protein